jgi:hypothetical protein
MRDGALALRRELQRPPCAKQEITRFDKESMGSRTGMTESRAADGIWRTTGTIVIESKPTGGTAIHVRVPFEHRSQRLEG